MNHGKFFKNINSIMDPFEKPFYLHTFLNCSYTQHSFVCKKPANGDWPQPSPTPIPEGHCTADFTEYQGYCYKILGFAEGEEKHDWHFAKDHCRDDYKAELASFHSAREAAKATTMLASLSYDTTDESLNTVWIGGYESYDSIWWWTDETQWQFSNWAPGEPDDMNYYEVKLYVQI